MLGFSKCWLWRLLTLGLLGMMLTITVPNTRVVRADTIKHGVRLASPAVVRILTTITGQVICNSCAVDGSTVTFSKKLAYSGTGALINPGGYVLTADHVVNIPQNDIQAGLLRYVIKDYAKAQGISEDEATRLFNLHQSQLTYPYTITDREVFLSTAYTGSPVTEIKAKYRFTDIFDHWPQQDIAIIKITAQEDLPYLSLALPNKIQAQDNVTAISFPGNTETSSFADLTDPTYDTSNSTFITALLTPSVQTGQVTATNRPFRGTTAYTTTNIGSFGSSGGPVVNEQGEIIGFVDAMSTDGLVNFLIPSETIAPYVNKDNIANIQTGGTFMNLWRRAINEYDGSEVCHWTNASKDLKQLKDKYSKFGGVQDLLNTALANVTPTDCPPPSSSIVNWPILLGLSTILLLAGTGLFFFVFRRRKISSLVTIPTNKIFAAIVADRPIQADTADTIEQKREMTASTQIWRNDSEVAPITRQCTSGHIVTLETASFCPECGAPIKEPKESENL